MNKKWKNGASSPVLFFIDDVTNRWVDIKKNGILNFENDFGYGGLDNKGVFNFLNKEILAINPKVKATLFVVTDSMSPVIKNNKNINRSFPINNSSKSKLFFRKLYNNKRFELAYHGTNHGFPGKECQDFIQEWDSFNNFYDAMDTIKKGKELFKDTIGVYPKGGKYCGYKSNEFSDESVDNSNFIWWCRFYNSGAVAGFKGDIYGNDGNPDTAFNVKFFGKNNVLDIPTTVPGNLLNSVFQPTNGIKGLIKKLLEPLLIRVKLRKIDYLLKRNQIISIQEHISPTREDGKRQDLNIVDDKKSLQTIFKYLKKKNVWYCTGTELANWVTKETKD